jgi:SAM-dependent methyltransferase
VIEKNWFDPDALGEVERRTRSSNLEKVRNEGDFGCYAVANRGEGVVASLVESHNLVYAFQRVLQYRRVLKRRSFYRIADMGCGLGLTTEALSRVYPEARVVGFEISHDAVEYARRTFHKASFEQIALGPKAELGASFDLILCQEFYPFTRTGDWDVHREYIGMLLRHLEPDGILLIELSERDSHKTVLRHISKLEDMKATVAYLPFDRIFRKIRLFGLSHLLSFAAATALKRDRNVCIMLSGAEAIAPLSQR